MITASWAGALALLLVVAVIAWIGGCVSGDRWRRQDYADVVGFQRREATALRMLYAATGYEFPDDDSEPPEPAAPWWERAWAWVRDRMPRRKAQEPPIHWEPDAAEDDEPEPERDTGEIPAQPGPATVPDMKQAAKVPPLSVLTDDAEWIAKRDEMLAAFRAEMDQIQGAGR